MAFTTIFRHAHVYILRSNKDGLVPVLLKAYTLRSLVGALCGCKGLSTLWADFMSNTYGLNWLTPQHVDIFMPKTDIMPEMTRMISGHAKTIPCGAMLWGHCRLALWSARRCALSHLISVANHRHLDRFILFYSPIFFWDSHFFQLFFWGPHLDY